MKMGKRVGDFFSGLLSAIWMRLHILLEVHYINGPETLPPPLTPDEEADIMQQILLGKEEAREPLITHNLRLVVYIANRFRMFHIPVFWDFARGKTCRLQHGSHTAVKEE